MSVHLRGDSVSELFTAAVALARAGGKSSPRGLATREVLGVSMSLTRPRARLVAPASGRILNPAFAAAEMVWILSGSDAPWIFDYNAQLRQFADDGVLRGAYGPRMRNWAGRVDQLRQVVEVLRADPDSRRATIQIYDPVRDAAGHKDVPCTLGFRFHLRGGRLHMSTTMRSQDAWLGLPYDLFTFTTLHELVAGWLDAELGEYRHHVDSLHVYERDLSLADGLTGKVESPDMPKLAIAWQVLGSVLEAVRSGTPTSHPGWAALADTMRSYRLWKSGDRLPARELAKQIPDPLGGALTSWYRELSLRSTQDPAVTEVR